MTPAEHGALVVLVVLATIVAALDFLARAQDVDDLREEW